MTPLSDYEVKRARNIERNNARLRALDLIDTHEEEDSNARAWGKPNTSKSDGCVIGTRSKRQTTTISNPSPIRKSRRVRGITPDTVPLVSYDERSQIVRPPIHNEREQQRVRECRAAALSHYQPPPPVCSGGGATKKATAPGTTCTTATYEHCLMRVKSMTYDALVNRVNAIERAAGKHCVVKMAIFKSCLQDEGMWDLADLADLSLERLKALQTPPDN
jgi:hypothetical protein